MYMHVCVCIIVCMYVCTYVCMYDVCMYACICVYVCMSDVCMMYVCMYLCVCMYVCMFICMCTCTILYIICNLLQVKEKLKKKPFFSYFLAEVRMVYSYHCMYLYIHCNKMCHVDVSGLVAVTWCIFMSHCELMMVSFATLDDHIVT